MPWMKGIFSESGKIALLSGGESRILITENALFKETGEPVYFPQQFLKTL